MCEKCIRVNKLYKHVKVVLSVSHTSQNLVTNAAHYLDIDDIQNAV